eukprot:12741321-Heterocapsa_arctica.AAC.1
MEPMPQTGSPAEQGAPPGQQLVQQAGATLAPDGEHPTPGATPAQHPTEPSPSPSAQPPGSS